MGVYSGGAEIDRNVLCDDVRRGVFADCRNDQVYDIFPAVHAERNQRSDDGGAVREGRGFCFRRRRIIDDMLDSDSPPFVSVYECSAGRFDLKTYRK